ncbi:hypothetical protein ARMGADRAFT_188945 [Armillaria gallica]|uniref:Uncharacterized protein n=1 Tax=Armillaria gallica TaxID=47427 RepID=A0A2H3D9A0_ARMGA|nr:hypothetical protein ARMGADRAFT_188945 [Armillaria gallica]
MMSLRRPALLITKISHYQCCRRRVAYKMALATFDSRFLTSSLLEAALTCPPQTMVFLKKKRRCTSTELSTLTSLGFSFMVRCSG